MLQNFEKLASQVPIQPLLEALGRQPELWAEITARQNTPGSPHNYTEAIFLRWAQSQTVEAAFTEIPAVDYPALSKLAAARGLILDIARYVGAKEFGRAMIVNLKPGGFIYTHADEGAYADHYERFHLCLQSDPGNFFLNENEKDQGEYVHMLPGELWYFNHKARHTLFNSSNRPRIHLIVDMVVPEYRKERQCFTS